MSAPTATSRPAREPLIERPGVLPAGPRDVVRDIGPHYVLNGLVGLVFAASGPVAVVLTVGRTGGLTAAQLASWIFGIFFVGGVLTLVNSLVYRQPLGFGWTIPGTVLIGPALGHLSWPEVIGAFFATGVLIIVLAMTGLVRKVMAAIPMPIVMAMVAGVFLSFGTNLVHSVGNEAFIAGSMVLVYLLLTRIPRFGRFLPPVLGALLVGAGAVAASGKFTLGPGAFDRLVVAPEFTAPQWSVGAMVELVVPLAITVLVVQNGQGVAVLRAAGHNPPVTVSAIGSGVGSLLSASVGAISACLTGPTNALLTSSGERRRQYTAAVSLGIFSIAFGLLSPALTQIMLATPEAYILALGGIAMLPSLQAAFITSFRTKYTWGAMITFVITVSGLSILNIGSAFWGLVIGYACSRVLEPADYRPELGAEDPA
ncbi:MAG: benzoate/H(+) symporter BenE family transporter [Propionibacteriaceae bacterium]|nr:benzoate/H(+) symporter BenE family transporter [Propionibacteriaceae bacterium]